MVFIMKTHVEIYQIPKWYLKRTWFIILLIICLTSSPKSHTSTYRDVMWSLCLVLFYYLLYIWFDLVVENVCFNNHLINLTTIYQHTIFFQVFCIVYLNIKHMYECSCSFKNWIQFGFERNGIIIFFNLLQHMFFCAKQNRFY